MAQFPFEPAAVACFGIERIALMNDYDVIAVRDFR
jgi:hypothetical protein